MKTPIKALVTGASGFVGSTLIEELGRRGVEVHALLRKSSSVANLKTPSFTRVEGDLSDFEALKRAVIGMDVVYHVAGVVSASGREEYFRHNATGTANLARAVAEANPGLKRFVLVSSLAAAGPAPSLDRPRVETDGNTPVSAYGESKLAGEQELLKHRDLFPVVIVRPPMVYGPRDKAVFTIVQTVSRKMMPLLQGGSPGGHKYYSCIHVQDLCQGIIRAGEAEVGRVPSGEIFYLTDGGTHTYQDLLQSMADALNIKALKFQVPMMAIVAGAQALSLLGKLTGKTYPLNIDKLSEIRPDYWICSTGKAQDALGYQPQFTLQTGMADAIQWYKFQKWI